MPHRHPRPRLRRLVVPALAMTLFAGCARSAPPAVVAGPGEAEPIHDTIQEFRKGERIACAQGTDLVYVVARDGSLHSFDPTDNRFRRIGVLDCPGTRRSRPHSMAVDRSGQAWIGYDNGVVALANIVSGECRSSKVDVGRAQIGRRFGMGFAPTPQGEIGGETLFLTPSPEATGIRGGRVVRGSSFLARIDDGATIAIAGEFPPPVRGLAGELSSRSDGKLFAFFAGDPFQLAEIDPATADVRWQTKLEGIRFSETGSGSWAFAAVGSEFFFFWADHGGPSTVTRLKGDGTIEHVLKDAGIEIVGAGASTCATRTPKNVASAPSLADEYVPPAPPPPAPPPPDACECPLEAPPAAPPAPVTKAPTPFSKLPSLPPPTSKLAPTRRPTPKPSPAPQPQAPTPKRPRIPHAVMRD